MATTLPVGTSTCDIVTQLEIFCPFEAISGRWMYTGGSLHTSIVSPATLDASVESNVLYLVMGHPLVMGHYFHFVKSNKTYNNSLTIHLEKLIFE